MKKPITIMVVIHNDLQDYSREKLYDDHFSWLQTELEDISGRPVFIHMSDKNDVPELSDYSYRNTDVGAAAEGWKQKTGDLHNSMSQQQSFHSGLVKILLLTRNNVDETLWGLLGSVGGVTFMKSYAGIAAITSRQAAAHEIGHMLGATHEDSEVHYDGWWKDSVMLADQGSQFRGNSDRFSDKNRQNIRDYLAKFP
ncbi:reprolysin-like metallopeptidase [Pseudomonas sp. LB3P31]